jgi:hypothetical protein
LGITRRPGPPHVVTPREMGETVYEVTLSRVPSPVWRAAFLWPPKKLTRLRYTPELGRLGIVARTGCPAASLPGGVSRAAAQATVLDKTD